MARLAAPRALNATGAAACAGLLAYALFTQYFQGLEPCPLCMFQRVALAALGLVFLAAALHHPRGALGARFYAVLIGLTSLAAAGIAGRHVYVQTQPPGTVPACGAPLEFMFDALPWTTAVRRVLTASGECGTISWQFLGLSMPGWVLLWAVLLGALGVAGNWRRP